ncbi:MAG: S8 family serine peptidase [Gemmatimonadota bacterium]|nr:S8 family serine peptidase [Gemmatimonadota bacterium]
MSTETESGDFYWANGKRVPLYRDPRMFAVRFRPGRRDDDPDLSEESRTLLRNQSRNVGTIRGHGIHIYEADDDGPATDSRAMRDASAVGQIASRVASLGREPGVEFTAPVLRRSATDADPIVPTPRFLVSFKPEVGRDEIDEFNAGYDVRIESRLGYVENGFALIAPDADGDSGAIALSDVYFRSGLTEFAMPDLIRRRHFRATVETAAATTRTTARSGGDLRSAQWHLDQIDIDGAWQITRGSLGVRVAILDDGIDLGHPEFSGTGKVSFQYDFEDDDPDATPSFSNENHGTACAGVAVASGIRAFGAAPDCALMAIRTPFQLGVSDEARMFQRAADEAADVISCSWGPPDGTGAVDPLPDPTRAAIDYCVDNGRGGLGIPIFWAAGNGAESVSDDGYAAYHRVIAVAACTDAEQQSWYSDSGPEVDITAPSNGGTLGILTTDRRGSAGYNSGSASLGDTTGDYTNDFGGTSSATPLAAGVAGLILSVAPNLRWDQVKQILEETADKIGGSNEYDSSGHSDRFGKGRINARAAVERARTMAGGSSGPSTPSNGSPTIQGPQRIDRSGSAPAFTVNAAGRPFMAVEVATEARLFDFDSHGGDRSSSNYYPDWDAGGSTTSSTLSWRLPDDVWQQMRHADALFYRVHVADDPDTWANYDVSLEDGDAALAPSSPIGAGSSVSPVTTSTTTSTETTETTSTATSTVRFPSGASFAEVVSPDDDVDYSDTVAGGIVPLIEVRDRLDDQLSANFRVEEFASREVGGRRKTRYSRISPELIERLQELRESIGSAITITSGYRYPALNAEAGGVGQSQHIPGRAVDMRATGHTPLELAEVVLDVFGFDIGIGLGSSIVHVDLRGTLASWTYSGAELSESEFDDWVRERRASRRSAPERRSEAAALDGFVSVSAPSSWHIGSGVPTFAVRPGNQSFWGLEVVTDRRAFTDEGIRSSSSYWKSWSEALSEAGDGELVTVPLDEAAWEEMRGSDTLWYRAFTSSAPHVPLDLQITTADEDVDNAPPMAITREAQRDPRIAALSDELVRRADEARWRDR